MNDDAFIRLVNVFELLARSDEALTQEQITDAVPGFPEGGSARARAFERVKASLRELGVPLETIVLPGRSHVGYFVDREKLQLDLELDEDEERALETALGCATFGVEVGDPGRSRLGLIYRTGAPIIWELPDLDRVPGEVGKGITERREIVFGYRDRKRHLVPDGVVVRWGHAYLVGTDVESGGDRVFRVDRIQGDVAVGEPRSEFSRRDLASYLPRHRWQVSAGREGVWVRVRMPLLEQDPLALETGSRTVSGQSVEGETWVAQEEVFLATVLGWKGAVEVLGPPEFVGRMCERLAATRTRLAVEPSLEPSTQEGEDSRFDHQAPAKSKLVARFDLLASVLAYLRRRGGSGTLGELAMAFSRTPEDLATLLESASLCGVPPYSPDVLFEILVDRDLDQVEVRLDSPLSGPRTVDLVEAITTLISVEAVEKLMADEVPALSRAVTKLRAAIGAQYQHDPVVADLESPYAISTVRAAVLADHCLEFDYRPTVGEEGHRHVRPVRMFFASEYWYLQALHRGQQRRYRVDRMSRVTSVPRDDCASPSAYAAVLADLTEGDLLGIRGRGTVIEVQGDGDVAAILDVAAMGSSMPCGPSRFRVWSLSPEWTALLLVQLGPDARTTATPEDVRAALALARDLGQKVFHCV